MLALPSASVKNAFRLLLTGQSDNYHAGHAPAVPSPISANHEVYAWI